MPLPPPDFDEWFAASAGEDSRGARFGLRRDQGWLCLPSGHLVAMEPMGVPDPENYAFVQAVPPGGYRVDLLIEESSASHYVAAARVVIRDEPAGTWELALRPGQDDSALDADSFFGFPVDGGAACFIDAETIRTGDDLELPDTDGEGWDQVLRLDIGDTTESFVTLTDPNQDEAPIAIAFASGVGDGSYPTWVGRTTEGDITCFATDFMLSRSTPVRWPAGRSLPEPAAPGRKF